MTPQTCIVCHQDFYREYRLGRGTSRTCSIACSTILNGSKSDEQARKKWLTINEDNKAYRRFVLGFRQEEA